MQDEYLNIKKELSAFGLRTEISKLSPGDEQMFLEMAIKSKEIHQPWVAPAMDVSSFQELLNRNTKDNFETVVVRPKDQQDIVGIFNLSQIFYNDFQNTIMGYYANILYHGQGYMREGLLQTVVHAFFKLKLHRIEANVICENERSIKFIRSFGFRHEGKSKNYLKINGTWRDHEKFALTREDWEDVVSQYMRSI